MPIHCLICQFIPDEFACGEIFMLLTAGDLNVLVGWQYGSNNGITVSGSVIVHENGNFAVCFLMQELLQGGSRVVSK